MKSAASSINPANSKASISYSACTHCGSAGSLISESACCTTCGMPLTKQSGEVPMLGNMPFTYLVLLVSVFCLSMIFYLPR